MSVRTRLFLWTIVTAILAPAMLTLAAFSGFAFDHPDGGVVPWLIASPLLTMPITILVGGIGSWIAYARGRSERALWLAKLPALHLGAAVVAFAILATVFG